MKSVDLSGASGVQDITFTNNLARIMSRNSDLGPTPMDSPMICLGFFLLGQGESVLPSRRRHIRGGKGRSKESVRDSVADRYWDWFSSHLDCSVGNGNMTLERYKGVGAPPCRLRGRDDICDILSCVCYLLGPRRGRLTSPLLQRQGTTAVCPQHDAGGVGCHRGSLPP